LFPSSPESQSHENRSPGKRGISGFDESTHGSSKLRQPNNFVNGGVYKRKTSRDRSTIDNLFFVVFFASSSSSSSPSSTS
jgi:hypothetical protein